MLTLALGIGVNTAIFNFTDALLLRPPPVASADRLVEVWDRDVKAHSGFGAYATLSFPDYAYYRDHNQVFRDLVAFDGVPAFLSWSRRGQGELLQGQLASGNFFAALGIKPIVGRFFLPEEGREPGRSAVVVLSDRFWQREFAGQPDIVGRSLTLDGSSFTVIGVAPPGFNGMVVGIEPDLWLPIAMEPLIKHDPQFLTRRGAQRFIAIGVLKPKVTRTEACASMSVLAHQLERAYPNSNQDLGVALFPATLVPGPFRGYVDAFTGLLQVVVGLLLLIACINAANLFLVRVLGRRYEMVLRSAMGASRWRLVRQIFTESLLLSLLAGAAGFLLARWTAPLLLRFIPPRLPIHLAVTSDWRVLAFTLALSLLAGIIFGLAPSLVGTRLNLMRTLKEANLGGERRRSRLRNTLVVVELALCLALLVSGGLCLRSLLNAQAINPGFQVGHRLIATLDLQSLNYSPDAGRRFYEQLLERIKALPGVLSASLATYLPLGGVSSATGVKVPGHPPLPGQDGFPVQHFDLGPGYFVTMGTPLLRGREFTERDREGAPPVVVINQAFANRFWPHQDPVGQQVMVGNRPSRIIGVVATGKYRSLSEPPHAVLFQPFFQQYQSKATIVVHTAGKPESLAAAVRGAVARLNPNLALSYLGTLEQHLAFALFPVRVTGILLGLVGCLGLFLAVLGLSRVVAYSIAQRTREIGVRMALGATRGDVLRLVVGEGARLSFWGIGIGLVLALALTRFLSGLLYGISPTDLTTFLFVSVLLVLATLLASYLPARRASLVDPMEALRYE